MMTWMRRISPYLLAAVLIAFIVSLAYFGTQRGSNGGGGGGAAVVTVDGDTVSAVTFDRAYRAAVEQTRQMAGDRWTEELPKVLRLREQVVERLIDERLVAKGAAREGIQVSDQELAEQIMRIGAFQEGGRFSRDRYVRLLAMTQPPMTPGDFEGEFRAELVRQRLQALIVEGAKVSEAEARQAWEADRSKVRAGYLLVTAARARRSRRPTPSSRPTTRRTPRSSPSPAPEGHRGVLPTASVPAPTVTDADVEAAFKARRSQFEQPARTRVSHILVKVPMVGGSAAEDQAKARAESALRASGAAPTSPRSLGRCRRTRRQPEPRRRPRPDRPRRARARGRQGYPGLKPGEVAGPLRSPFGYHVLKVFEVVPATRKELKEIAPTLRATLAAEGQMKAHRDKAQDAQKALLVASDFAAEARKLGLTVREAGPLRRGDPIEGIGGVAEASDAIFTLPPDGVSGPVRVPGRAGHLPARRHRALPASAARPGPPGRAARRSPAEGARAGEGAGGEARRGGAEGRRPARALVRQGGATYSEVGPFSRAEPLGDRALGQVLGPSRSRSRTAAWARPSKARRVLRGEAPRTRTPRSRRLRGGAGDVEARLLREKRARLWQAWLAAARAGAKIEINRQLLSEG